MATKTELQEQALELELSVHYPEDHEKAGKEMTNADLEDAIDLARTAAQEEVEAAEAVEAGEGDGDEPDDEEEPEPEPEPEPTPTPKPKAKVKRASIVRDPSEALLKKMSTTVSDKDRKLAKKHGYPVAIPGGKAFITSVRINCIYGAGVRIHGSVVILDAAQAAHKSKWLKPVK